MALKRQRFNACRLYNSFAPGSNDLSRADLPILRRYQLHDDATDGVAGRTARDATTAAKCCADFAQRHDHELFRIIDPLADGPIQPLLDL